MLQQNICQIISTHNAIPHNTPHSTRDDDQGISSMEWDEPMQNNRQKKEAGAQANKQIMWQKEWQAAKKNCYKHQ